MHVFGYVTWKYFLNIWVHVGLALLHSKSTFILCPSMMSFRMFSAWQFLLANRTLAQAVNPSIEDFIVVMEMCVSP